MSPPARRSRASSDPLTLAYQQARGLWRQAIETMVKKDRVLREWPEGPEKVSRMKELDGVLEELDAALTATEATIERRKGSKPAAP